MDSKINDGGGRNSLKGESAPDPLWKGKYEIKTLMYPEKLFEPHKPLGAYVMFYINVFDASKAVTEKQVEFVSDNADVQSKRKNGRVKKFASDENAVKVSFVVGTAIGATAIGTLLGIKSPVGGGLGAGLALTAVAAMRDQNMNFTKSQKRLKQAIAMHMPNDIQIGYSATYSSESMSSEALGIKIGSDVTKAVFGTVDTELGEQEIPRALPQLLATSAAGEVLNTLKSYSGAATALALDNLPFGKFISSVSGIAKNPMTQQVFEGVTPRAFEMQYNLYAHSEDELENIHRIINTFKKNMLPEYKQGSDDFLFVYPAEFDIEYYFGAENNNYIHRVTSCVLTDCIVNYTPDGVFNHFNKNGAPVKIGLKLAFRELDILTRDDIQIEGGGY